MEDYKSMFQRDIVHNIFQKFNQMNDIKIYLNLYKV